MRHKGFEDTNSPMSVPRPGVISPTDAFPRTVHPCHFFRLCRMDLHPGRRSVGRRAGGIFRRGPPLQVEHAPGVLAPLREESMLQASPVLSWDLSPYSETRRLSPSGIEGEPGRQIPNQTAAPGQVPLQGPDLPSLPGTLDIPDCPAPQRLSQTRKRGIAPALRGAHLPLPAEEPPMNRFSSPASGMPLSVPNLPEEDHHLPHLTLTQTIPQPHRAGRAAEAPVRQPQTITLEDGVPGAAGQNPSWRKQVEFLPI